MTDAAAVSGDSPEQPNLSGIRILVVDDDTDSRDIAAKALAVTGASVIKAASGFEAVDYWRQEPFDILICDLAMPGMDGYGAYSGAANGHRTVAIALTALASDSERRAVLAAGFDDHLVKPFNFADLLRAVSRPA